MNLLRLLATALSLAAILAFTGCTNSDDDGPADVASGPPGNGVPSVPSSDDDGVDEPSAAAISVDNSVALLAEAFDIGSGRIWDDALALLDAFADGATSSGDTLDPETRLRVLDYACENGGSATFAAIDVYPREPRLLPPPPSRDALFESCLFEGVTYDGEIEARRGAPDTQALTLTMSDGMRLTLSGELPQRLVDSLLRLTHESHSAGDAHFETSGPEGMFLVDADVINYRHGFIFDGGVRAYDAYLSMGASFASPTSGGVAIEVSTPETLDYRKRVAYSATTDAWNFTAGNLHLAAADGSALVLEADTGGLPTPEEAAAHARVVVTDPDGKSVERIVPWTTWHENLRHDATQYRPVPPTLEPERDASGAPTVGVDAHIDLLGRVFAVFTGREGYGQQLIDSPVPLTDVPEEQRVFSDPNSSMTLVESLRGCPEGGTANGAFSTASSLGEIAYAVREYTDCGAEGRIANGVVESATNSFEASVASTALAVEGADGTPVLEFSGQVTEHYPSYTNDGYRNWRLRDARIARNGDGVVVEAATTSFGSGARTSQREFNAHLGGHFVLRSPETGGRTVLVETLEELDLTATLFNEDDEPVSDPAIDSQRFTSGRLRVSAGDGSALLLEAAPGEDGAVAITFTDGAATSTLRTPWSAWPEVLRPL